MSQFNDEYLLKFQKAGDSALHSIVYYRTEHSLDENGDPDCLTALWVAARGYEGGGIYSSHSAICRFEGEGEATVTRTQHAYPDNNDFYEYDDNPPFEPTERDITILDEIWVEVDKLSTFDIEVDPPLASQLIPPKEDDFICSSGWYPDDLIETVSDGWQLTLRF
jgi:hypothetical protein